MATASSSPGEEPPPALGSTIDIWLFSGSSRLVQQLPEAPIQLEAEACRHQGEIAALVSRNPCICPMLIKNHQSVSDPELKGLRVEADSIARAKIMGNEHGHMLNEAALRAIQQEW